MTVNVQGPLALLTPKPKATRAPADDGAAGAPDTAAPSPRSFADVLAAAQPRADETTAREEKDPVEARGDDPPVDEALPPWLVPTPVIESVRSAPVARGGAETERTSAAVAAARPSTRGLAARADAHLRHAADDVAPDDLPVGEAVHERAASAPIAAPPSAPHVAADDDALAAISRALAPLSASESRPVSSANAAPADAATRTARRAPEQAERGSHAGDTAAAPVSPTDTAAPGVPSTRLPPTAPTLPAAPAPMHDPHAERARETDVETERAAPAPQVAPREGLPTPAREAEAAPAVTSAAATSDAAPLAQPLPVTHGAERVRDPVAIHVERPVASPGWAEEVTGALAHAITVRHASAQLHLHPESMGPVDVRISVSGGEASVQLVAAHAATREALADALPMLRDLLGSQGLALGQAAVESRAQQDTPQPSAQPRSDGHATPKGADVRADDTPTTVIRVLRLLDVFA